MYNWLLVLLWSLLVIGVISLIAVVIALKVNGNKKLSMLAYVFIIIWGLRFWVNFFSVADEMSVFEKCIDSFVHALQTFSMDEDYTSYTIAGKELLNSFGFPNGAVVYGIIISILNVCAPIMGGAILLEVLTGFSPRLRLCLHPRKRKFVFSELNEASITLAEDFYLGENYQRIVSFEAFNANDENGNKKDSRLSKLFLKYKKPLIIFTDAYIDDESEEKSEIFDRAKAIRAICMKTDLQFLSLSRSEAVYYFFIDEEENLNVSGLSGIIEKQKITQKVYPQGKDFDHIKTRIYVFCHSDLTTRMVNTISAKVDQDDPIIIRSIPDYTNAAVNLMYEVPLFIPLLDREKGSPSETQLGQAISKVGDFYTEKDSMGRVGGVIPTRELHVTILGGGVIASEIFKAVYWCGQISGVQLFIHVITKNAKKFKNNIMSSCPELLESCKTDSKLLRCYPKSDSPLSNAPYALVDGLDKDVDAEDYVAYPSFIIDKSDYLVVALGEDGKNIATALMLKQQLSRRLLNTGNKSHPVIAPAVFDKRLAEPITVLQPEEHEPYVTPFALRQKRFSCRSVFMSDITVDAWKNGSIYDKKSHEKRKKDEYSYWANIYRAIHAPYKMFAFGLVTAIDLSAEPKERYQGGGQEIKPDDVAYSWMEHRRWNACIRAQGFTMPTDHEHIKYFSEKKLHKDLSRKYHNCLVESSVRGSKMQTMDKLDLTTLDALDIESLKAYKMTCHDRNVTETDDGLQESEYKHWDDYINDASAQAMWAILSRQPYENN